MKDLLKLHLNKTQMTDSEKMDFLIEKIHQFEEEFAKLKRQSEDNWFTLEEASSILKKTTPGAIRQRIKHKKKPLPEGIVWKQESKGCTMYVNIAKFREHV